MRKQQHIKTIARVYVAHLVSTALGAGATSDLFTEQEFESFAKQVDNIAEKLTPHPLNLGSLDNIICYVDNIYKYNSK